MAISFIDLFAGLGGFHVGLSSLGHKCVFASEINEELAQTYEKNFGIRPHGDIAAVRSADIPRHDLLCAGFPCQPFSKAGSQAGHDCPKWGHLFSEVIRILRARLPQYFILENVSNLSKHNCGKTWKSMRGQLQGLGYDTMEKIISPHEIGIPQHRKRLFVVGSRVGLSHFEWPKEKPASKLVDLIESRPPDARPIPGYLQECFAVWQDFVQNAPEPESWFPIWSMEFGATYPIRGAAPMMRRSVAEWRGRFGARIKQKANLPELLPSYGRGLTEFPDWKSIYIDKNREYYRQNRRLLDKWKRRIRVFPECLQKLEWNCTGESRDIYSKIVQVRASGVRVSRSDRSPALVAMTTTQVPIVAGEGRYMTVRECARLQSLDRLRNFPGTTVAYKALGNAVNAKLVRSIAAALTDTNARLRSIA